MVYIAKLLHYISITKSLLVFYVSMKGLECVVDSLRQNNAHR